MFFFCTMWFNEGARAYLRKELDTPLRYEQVFVSTHPTFEFCSEPIMYIHKVYIKTNEKV